MIHYNENSISSPVGDNPRKVLEEPALESLLYTPGMIQLGLCCQFFQQAVLPPACKPHH